MNDKKVKLRHAGFVIGVALLLIGWGTRLVAAFVLAGTVEGHTLGKVGTAISGASVFFLLGGIIFYAAVSSREQASEPMQQLTEEQQEQNLAQELEDASYEIKNSIPFTAVYGAIAILFTLGSVSIVFFHGNDRLFGVGGLLAGLFLSQYYIRMLIRQFKWLSSYKRSK